MGSEMCIRDRSRATLDQGRRKILFDQIQQLIAEDLPYINLWYLDDVIVHTRRVRNIALTSSGNYGFLRTAEIAP